MFSNIILQKFGKKIISKNSETLVNQPAFHLSQIFFLGFFHVGLLYLGFPSPLALLFVPLIYLTSKANENLNTTRNIIKHFIPFVFISIINIVCYVAGLFESTDFVKVYDIFSLIFTLIVGIFYLFHILSLNRSINISERDYKSLLYHKLIGQLCILSCFMLCMGGIKLIILLNGDTDLSIPIKMLWLALFLSSRLLIVLTWYRAEIQHTDLHLENKMGKVAYDENLHRNKVMLIQYLEQSEIFLDPDLTLPALAEKTGMSERGIFKISKSIHWSEFLSTHCQISNSTCS